jgi:hypothetical protein
MIVKGGFEVPATQDPNCDINPIVTETPKKHLIQAIKGGLHWSATASNAVHVFALTCLKLA